MKKFIFATILAIVIPLVVFGFLGCMKKPDNNPDYGPEVSFQDIQKTASEHTPPDPLSMKMGQYVSIDITQVVDVQPPMTLSQKLEEITAYDGTTNPSEILLDFKVDLNELTTGGVWKNSKLYPSLVLDRTTQSGSAATASVQNAPASRMGAYTLKALSTSTDSSGTPIRKTFHNLKREEGYLPVPYLVKNKPDCGGVKECDKGLRYLRISFDMVIWDTETHGNKSTYTITYSPDVPTYIADWSEPEGIYPSNQFQFCVQQWVEVGNETQKQIVPVQQCANMRDFQFGHD